MSSEPWRTGWSGSEAKRLRVLKPSVNVLQRSLSLLIGRVADAAGSHGIDTAGVHYGTSPDAPAYFRSLRMSRNIFIGSE